jgi:sugar phosphate permease
MCPESIVQVVVIFFFRFSIAIEFALFLVYTVELFPARIVGLGNGAVSAVGTIASTLSPLILGYLKRMEFNLMMFFLILGIIGCALTLLLEETHGKPLKVEIEEIQYAKNKRKSEYKSDSKIHFLNSQKIL